MTHQNDRAKPFQLSLNFRGDISDDFLRCLHFPEKLHHLSFPTQKRLKILFIYQKAVSLPFIYSTYSKLWHYFLQVNHFSKHVYHFNSMMSFSNCSTIHTPYQKFLMDYFSMVNPWGSIGGLVPSGQSCLPGS